VPPVLSGAFRVLNANSEVTRSGYFFQMYLPGAAGVGVVEDDTDSYTDGGGQDPDLAETTWCCYSWPVNYNQSGNRTFFTNQGGDVIACEVSDYSGTGAGPEADAAFAVADAITGSVDIGGPGQNAGGELWRQVN
jgi:hypothetical protein